MSNSIHPTIQVVVTNIQFRSILFRDELNTLRLWLMASYWLDSNVNKNEQIRIIRVEYAIIVNYYKRKWFRLLLLEQNFDIILNWHQFQSDLEANFFAKIIIKLIKCIFRFLFLSENHSSRCKMHNDT